MDLGLSLNFLCQCRKWMTFVKKKKIADHLSGSDTTPRTEDRVFASHWFSGLRLATFFQLESKFKATAMLADGNEVREYSSCDVYVTPT